LCIKNKRGEVLQVANVLVIEDQASIGMVFNVILSDEGHKVDVVRDGKAGLKRLAQEPKPDIVLVDLLMPGMSGREVVETMRRDSRTQDIPVIIISGCIPGSEEMPPAGSYSAFIGKPFDILDITATVGKLTAAKQDCA
jgi:CheY-like chemotaxis protein